ncbi:MAG: hypothetical protein KKH98_00315, partial [Spirochaetes bacterium]|nr:hypothetical protein [Spirochaetota bacterium]
YQGMMSAFVGNHDFARFMGYADGDLPMGSDERKIGFQYNIKVDHASSYQKLKKAFLCLFSLSEIPLIYYGDEIGLTGGADPDNRRMMKFEGLNKDEKDLFLFTSRLIRFRKIRPAMYQGVYLPLSIKKDHIIYAKIYYNEVDIIGIARSSKKEITIELPAWLKINKVKDLFSGRIINVRKNRIKIKEFEYFLYSSIE